MLFRSNYRTPAEIARTAQRLAIAAGLPVSPLTSAREVPDALRVRLVGDGRPDQDILDVVTTEAEAALAELAPTGPGPGSAAGGRVAVITVAERVAEVRDHLAASRISGSLRPASALLDAPLAVLSPRASKGLEFDIVVLVEPSQVSESPGDLYVAMTRPTRALVIVTTVPLTALDAAQS